MKAYALAVAALLLTACAPPPQGSGSGPAGQGKLEQGNPEPANLAETQTADAGYRPPPGSNQMLRSPISLAEGVEVIISDVVIPPNATVPRHYHLGEEFIYVIEGSAVHIEEGKPEQILKAGDTYVIPPEAEHAPRGGEEGARAIVFRVHKEGEEERILVDE